MRAEDSLRVWLQEAWPLPWEIVKQAFVHQWPGAGRACGRLRISKRRWPGLRRADGD